MSLTMSDTKTKRGRLIQPFRGFAGELEPVLSEAFSKFNIRTEKQQLECLQWIIQREAISIWLLIDPTHKPHALYELVHGYLTNNLSISLSECVSHYFAFPRLWGDDVTIITLRYMGLIVDYFSEPINSIKSTF